MIVIGGLLLGALLGAFIAKRRGGRPADMAQYAAVYGILLGIAGLFATIAYSRMLM